MSRWQRQDLQRGCCRNGRFLHLGRCMSFLRIFVQSVQLPEICLDCCSALAHHAHKHLMGHIRSDLKRGRYSCSDTYIDHLEIVFWESTDGMHSHC